MEQYHSRPDEIQFRLTAHRVEECKGAVRHHSESEKNRYETIKKELRRLSDLRSQRIERLSECKEIGDRSPSQFLRHMRVLAGEAVADFPRTMWVNRLPPTTRAVVSAMDQPLDDLAAIADRIQETAPQVASVARGHEKELRQELKELRGRSHERQCVNQRGSDRRADHGEDRCWYHQTFDDRSKKC